MGAKTQKCRGTDPQIVANPHILKKNKNNGGEAAPDILSKTVPVQNFVPELCSRITTIDACKLSADYLHSVIKRRRVQQPGRRRHGAAGTALVKDVTRENSD